MIISVKVSPNAKKSGIIKTDENNFRVKVDAAAEKGESNRRLIEMLANYFNVAKSSVSIVKGFKSRSKVVEIKFYH
jgi:hypothetical protein